MFTSWENFNNADPTSNLLIVYDGRGSAVYFSDYPGDCGESVCVLENPSVIDA